MSLLILGILIFGLVWTIFLAIFRPELLSQWQAHKEARRRDTWNAAGKAASWWIKNR